jgi:hypothetical protein
MTIHDSSGPQALKCPQCGGDLPSNAYDAIICPYCASSLVLNRSQSASGAGNVVHGLRLRPIICDDPQGTGLPVFRLLVPSGWQVQGGCRWNLDNPGMPVTISFRVSNPQGAEAFEILPNINFTWNTNPHRQGLTPPGSRQFGAEVRPPVNIRDAFLEYIFPRYRSYAQGLEVIEITPLPELPRLVKSEAMITPDASAEGGKVRFRYSYRNYPFEEEMYAVVETFRAHFGTLFGQTNLAVWFIDFIFTFRSMAGHLDTTADLFTVMLNSFQPNPHWSVAVKTITQMLAQQQINHIHQIGQIGQMLAQAGSQMREQNLNDWYRRQEVYDRLSLDRSRAIRDVDGFYDPHRQEVVELPSGYGHAWTNDLGEYILTEDPNFNPNQESSQNWEPMLVQ